MRTILISILVGILMLINGIYLGIYLRGLPESHMFAYNKDRVFEAECSGDRYNLKINTARLVADQYAIFTADGKNGGSSDSQERGEITEGSFVIERYDRNNVLLLKEDLKKGLRYYTDAHGENHVVLIARFSGGPFAKENVIRITIEGKNGAPALKGKKLFIEPSPF